jgi:predicted aldo/keto reductase-like oxidoreductase
MKEETNRIDRRNFLKTVGAAGLGSVLASTDARAQESAPAAKKPTLPQIPRQKFGRLTWPDKSGKKVPIELPVLSFGTFRVDTENQLLLRKAFQYGMNYWDTAWNYQNGQAELGIGKFIKRSPQLRKDLFIASKASKTQTIAEIESRLQDSLKRMNTDYIDLYYLHEIEQMPRLNNDLRDWAKSAKDRGLIRFFGFTVHRDMTKFLNAAAKLDWIEGILVKYNWRDMQDPELNKAVEACHKAGIALTAMKVMGKGSDEKIETEGDKKLTDHFIKRGFTAAQAKIKCVIGDKRIASVSVGMQNVKLLDANVAAALDETKLTAEDMQVFDRVAHETCSGHCAGCGEICELAVPQMPYVSDVMRYLMYYHGYGEQAAAKEFFAEIPAQIRHRLGGFDYTAAEARCPQRMPIGKLMAEAAQILA